MSDHYRHIPAPEWSPHQCAASLRSQDPEGFIDSGMVCQTIEPRIILSVSWLKDVARQLGMTDSEKADERIVEAEVALEVAEQRIVELERQLLAIDFIESAGFRARKKTGRPPGKREEAEVAA